MTLRIYQAGELFLSINGFNTIDEAITFARDRCHYEQNEMLAEVWQHNTLLTIIRSWDLIPVFA